MPNLQEHLQQPKDLEMSSFVLPQVPRELRCDRRGNQLHRLSPLSKADSNSVGGALVLPSNFLLTNALDHLSVKSSKEYTLHCTNCEDEAAATSRCLECAEFLCSNCVLAHRRIRVTKDHRILSLDKLQADKQTLHRPSFCKQHVDEMFMFYCVPCDRLICRECTILDHRGHKYAGKQILLETYIHHVLPIAVALHIRFTLLF